MLRDLRELMGAHDLLVSDVGAHKLWISRMWPTHQPNTVLISNGAAAMGFAVPAGVAARMVLPADRKVVTISGDGGVLMNFQEIETAKRLGLAVVNLVWTDSAYGVIEMHQQRKFGRLAGTKFTNPDWVQLAESFGVHGHCGWAPLPSSCRRSRRRSPPTSRRWSRSPSTTARTPRSRGASPTSAGAERRQRGAADAPERLEVVAALEHKRESARPTRSRRRHARRTSRRSSRSDPSGSSRVGVEARRDDARGRDGVRAIAGSAASRNALQIAVGAGPGLEREVERRAARAGAARDRTRRRCPGKNPQPYWCSETYSTSGSSQKIASVPLPWCTSQSRIATRSTPRARAWAAATATWLKRQNPMARAALGVMAGRPRRR